MLLAGCRLALEAHLALQSRAVNGFLASEVDDALRGAVVGTVKYRTRVELLDSDNQVLREIQNLLEGEVKHNNTASIKRTLTCKIREATITLDDYPDIVIADNPLVYFRFGETSGTTANDSSGNLLHGNYNNAPILNTASLLLGDTTNGSVTFDGINDNVSRNHVAAFNVSRLSVEAWIQTSAAAYQVIGARDDAGANESWQLRTTPGGFLELVLWFGGVAGVYTSAVAINDGRPHHVVGTYDGVQVVLYVDSYRVLKTAETRSVNSATVILTFGINSAGGSPFTGTIDEVAYYGRALSSAEVREHYQKGAANFEEIDYTRDRIKPYIAVKMNRNGNDTTPWAEFPLGIFLLSAPDRNQSESGIDRPVEGFDQNTILMQDCVTARYVVTATTNYVTAVATVLVSAGLDISGYQLTPTTSTLPADRSWELGTPKLTIVNDLLRAINYKPFRFNSAGVGIAELYVLPESRAIDYAYSTDEFSVMTPDMSYSINMFDVPNVVVLSRTAPKVNTITSTARNNKIASPTSIVRRGNISIVYADPNYDAADQTTIDAAASRLLTEKSQAAQLWKFGTSIHPFHEDEDVLTITDNTGLYSFGVTDDFMETEWSLPFSDPSTAVMTHVAARIVPVV